MQHVGVDLRRKMKLLDVAQRKEPAPPDVIDVSEQAVLPEHRGEVGRLLELHVGQLLEPVQIRPREMIGTDHPDEAANVVLHVTDIGLRARVQLGVVVQGGIPRHEIRGDLIGALGELGVAEALRAPPDHARQGGRRQALVADQLLLQHLLRQLIAERDDVARDQPGVAQQKVLNRFTAVRPGPVTIGPEPVPDGRAAIGGTPHEQRRRQPLQLVLEQIQQRGTVPGQHTYVRLVVIPRRML